MTNSTTIDTVYANKATSTAQSDAQIRLAADNIMASYKTSFTPRMAERLSSGEDLTEDIRLMLVALYGAMYKVGAGESATSPAQLAMSRMLLVQYDYLESFMAQVPGMSVEAIEARLNMYIHSSRQALETGILDRVQEDLLFTVELPAMPGDGTTRCLTNCHCYWEHEFDNQNRWVGATWVFNDLYLHCTTCATRATVWNPLILAGYDGNGNPYRV